MAGREPLRHRPEESEAPCITRRVRDEIPGNLRQDLVREGLGVYPPTSLHGQVLHGRPQEVGDEPVRPELLPWSGPLKEREDHIVQVVRVVVRVLHRGDGVIDEVAKERLPVGGSGCRGEVHGESRRMNRRDDAGRSLSVEGLTGEVPSCGCW